MRRLPVISAFSLYYSAASCPNETTTRQRPRASLSRRCRLSFLISRCLRGPFRRSFSSTPCAGAHCLQNAIMLFGDFVNRSPPPHRRPSEEEEGSFLPPKKRFFFSSPLHGGALPRARQVPRALHGGLNRGVPAPRRRPARTHRHLDDEELIL